MANKVYQGTGHRKSAIAKIFFTNNKNAFHRNNQCNYGIADFISLYLFINLRNIF